MTSRRKLLAGMAAGAVAIPAGVALAGSEPVRSSPRGTDCTTPGAGRYASYLPNVVLQTHEGRRVRFYDDLVRGRTVTIHFMSVAAEAECAVCANLLEVRRRLDAGVGGEVTMLSITSDPEHDTPQALAEFAERVGAGPGWLFLTGRREDIDLLRGRLFARAGGHLHTGATPEEDCSQGLLRYGNEAVGLWGAVPLTAEPSWIAERLEWLRPRLDPDRAPSRRGPYRHRADMPWLHPVVEEIHDET